MVEEVFESEIALCFGSCKVVCVDFGWVSLVWFFLGSFLGP